MSRSNNLIKLQLGNVQFNVQQLFGHEAISQPYSFAITVIATNHNFIPEEYLNQIATLTIAKRIITGIITATKEQPLNDKNSSLITFTLQPKLALAALAGKSRAILHDSIINIIQDTLCKHGYQQDQLQFSLQKQYGNKPYTFQPPNESDLAFSQRLLANNRIFYWSETKNNLEVVQFSDNHNLCPELPSINYNPATNIDEPRVLAIQKTSTSTLRKELTTKIAIKTNIPTLLPGYRISLDNKEYLIEKTTHHYQQNIEIYGDNAPYYNRAILLSVKSDYRPQTVSLAKFAGVFEAKIETNHNSTQLDNIGRYQIRKLCSNSKQPHMQASIPIPKVTPASGWHTPLHDGAEVLISTLHGDPDQPIIIGAVPNKQLHSPVTSNNRSENILRSKNGNTLLFDDQKNRQKIELRTEEQPNLIEINAHKNHNHITIQSKNGAINNNAKETIKIINKNNVQINSAKQYSAIADNWIKIKSNRKILQQSGNNYQTSVKQNYNIKAANNITMASNKLLQFNSKKTVKITASNGIINTDSGDINIQSANNISIIGTENSEIEFAQNGTGFKITADGRIEIFGQQINVMATAGTQLLGRICYLDRPQATPALASYKKPTEIQPLANLTHKNSAIHTIDNKIKIKLHFDCNKQEADPAGFLDDFSYIVTAQKRITGDIKESVITLNHLDIDKTFELELNDQKQQQLLYIIGINGKSLPPKQKIVINKNELTKKDNSYHLAITVLHPPIICNIRYDNHRKNNLLTTKDLQYLKYNNNSATIFIHGYNVSYDENCGSYGNQIKHITIDSANVYGYKKVSRATATVTNKKETILRTKQQLQSEFPELNPWPTQTDSKLDFYGDLNGSGAHNWFTNIEDNLNRATANFHHTDYSNYTRIVNITWSGDPKYCFDYIQAAREIVAASKKLAAIIQQLIDNNIEINIIGHSLGCGVLLHVMNNLPKNSIKTVFLWEAAIPNNIFDKQHPPNEKLWQLPQAELAAKKIIILHSKNDNILGPIPRIKQNQIAINNSKPLAELILALFLTKLELGSIYNLAMWVGVPASELFNEKLQENIYQHWRKTHQDYSFAPTLAEQINKYNHNIPEYALLEQRFSRAQDAINTALTQAGHSHISVLLTIGEDVFAYLDCFELDGVSLANATKLTINSTLAYPKIKRAFGLIDIMLRDTIYAPTSALGYLGPANQKQLIPKSKFILAEQTKWLWDHSGMKIPSKDLMTKIYQHYIISTKNGIDDFAKFKSK